jgi:hypothetical protein
MAGQAHWGIDSSGLDPRTIDPHEVGPAAALTNFCAYAYDALVRDGELSRADAARGFDEVVAETERLFGQQPKSGG